MDVLDIWLVVQGSGLVIPVLLIYIKGRQKGFGPHKIALRTSLYGWAYALVTFEAFFCWANGKFEVYELSFFLALAVGVIGYIQTLLAFTIQERAEQEKALKTAKSSKPNPTEIQNTSISDRAGDTRSGD